jgi:lysyl-tRNA synthetase class 2
VAVLRGRQPERRGLIRHLPRLLAFATGAVGVLNVLSALTPEQASRLMKLSGVVPIGYSHVASALTAVDGVLLVFVGHGLRRRKRRAWRAAIVLLLLSAGLHLLKGLDVEEASIVLVLTSGLVAFRRDYYAAGDPRSRFWAPAAFVGMVTSSLLLGMGLLWFQRAHLSPRPSIWDQVREVVYGLIGVSGPVHFRTASTADLVSDVLLAFGLATAAVTAYVVLRPTEPPAVLGADDERRLRDLLDQHAAGDSLSYFALRRDKAAVFSASGKAAVSYRVVSGVMLASGDPIGDPEAWPGAIAAFAAEAARHAWVPAVVGCSERAGEVWTRESRLRALALGDEAIVDVEDFSLEGRAMRNVRQTARRVERAGYSARVRRLRDVPPAEVDAIRRESAAWRDAEVERGFSMALGRFGDAADGECVVVTAEREGRLAAVLHFVPWGPAGLSLDLMRRDRGSDSGLNELMIVTLLQAASALGVDRVSLNFAVFRDALDRGGRLGAGPVLRAWRGILLAASRWFQIESLFRFNAKFAPRWEPRFICYPSARDLPRITLAVLEAEAFITWPTQRRELRRARRLPVPLPA